MRSLSGIRLFGFLVILCLLSSIAPGQDKRNQGKVSKTAPVTVRKPSTESSCDGALDIVPSQASTFARKRRPTKTTAPPTVATPEKKTDPKA